MGGCAFRLETALPRHSAAKRRGGHRLREPSSICILRVVGAQGAELGWRQQVATAVGRPFGGGRDSLGDATQLHQSVIASDLPGKVSSP